MKYWLQKINPKKATGHDEIPGKFLNISAQLIAEPLAKKINHSVTKEQYPDRVKIANPVGTQCCFNIDFRSFLIGFTFGSFLCPNEVITTSIQLCVPIWKSSQNILYLNDVNST